MHQAVNAETGPRLVAAPVGRARRAAALLAAVLTGLAAVPPPASATPMQGGGQRLAGVAAAGSERDAGTLLVTTRAGTSLTEPARFAQVTSAVRGVAAAAQVRRVSGRLAAVQVPPDAEQAVTQRLRALEGVLAVEPSYFREIATTPDDPFYPQQWSHRLSRTERAWDVTTGSRDVIVAVIDTGVDGRHPDLVQNIAGQRLFRDGTETVVPAGTDNRQCGSDHGTATAGVVGATGNNGLGVAGVNWTVGLLDLAVASTHPERPCALTDADILLAMQAAVDAGADVINMSFSAQGSTCGTAYQSVIDAARTAGTVLVAAAGNHQAREPDVSRVPASCNGVISVGALTAQDERAYYSTANAFVDLAAPGGDPSAGVATTSGDGRIGTSSGTSASSPYVAGVAALLRAADPLLTPAQVEGLLESTARDLGASGRDNQFGWGGVDAGAALQAAAAGLRPAAEPDPDFPVGAGGADPELPPDNGPEVSRLWSGETSTEPRAQAVLTSRVVFPDRGAEHAVLAQPHVFADALAGSSLGIGSGPLLYANAYGRLPVATRDELLRVLDPGKTVYVLGGEQALSSTVDQELTALGYRPVRLAGPTREGTAVAVSVELDRMRQRLGRGPAPEVLLARGTDWPDAVAAGSIAAHQGWPILLTAPTALHPATAARLRSVQPDRLTALGGAAAISGPTLRAAAQSAGTTVETTRRLAGADRYETAVAIAGAFQEQLRADGQPGLGCVLASNVVRTGGWTHMLAATSYSAGYACALVPVAGATGDALPAATRAFAERLNVHGLLIGGRDLIRDAVGEELENLLQP